MQGNPAPLITSSYCQPSTVTIESPDSMLERSVKGRVQGQWGGNSRAGGIGLRGVEGGGSSGRGGWGWARSLTSTGLSKIESGGPQAANNNFVGCETVEKLQLLLVII